MTIASIIAALVLLGAPLETRGAIAEAVMRHARTPEEAAFLAAWGEHETHFQGRLIRNECRKWECDKGRARGAWQLHRGAAGSDWEALPGNIDAQARSAARMARWALRECKTPLGAFRRLGGLACDRPLKGEATRMKSYERARAVL